MIDRNARNRLLQGIDDYMDEKISPTEFNSLLHETIAPNTNDEIIREIGDWLSESYQDRGTNRLQSECAYWKFFNRLRLLLASDAEYQFDKRPRPRSLSQRIGVFSVLMLSLPILIFLCLQSWAVLLVFGIPLYALCGAVIFISLFFEKPSRPNRIVLYAEYPFESFAELLALRRSVPDFSSKRFPRKPPVPPPSRNPVIRFLWDTKCPAWVDRLGDAFILSFSCFFGLLWIIIFWPLLILWSFFAKNEGRIQLILPDPANMQKNSPASAPLG